MLKILFLNKIEYAKDLQQNYAFVVELMRQIQWLMSELHHNKISNATMYEKQKI